MGTQRSSLATAMVVLLIACSSSPGTSTIMTNGSGGQTQVGTGGRSGLGGQTTAAGGVPGGAGGRSGLGGQTTAAGGNPGGTGGRTTAAGGNPGGIGGQGGVSTETQPDAAAATGGRGGQGGNTSLSQVDASDTPTGGAGGNPGGDGGGASGKDVAADANVVGNPRRVLLSDEGNRRILLVDLQNPSSAVWSRQLSDLTKYGDSMRDVQLVGGDRVAVSVAKGYVELDIKTGEIKKEVVNFDGVESLRRLASGNTILGANANGGVTLQELDSQDVLVAGHNVTFTNYSQLRLFRRTAQGTFLIAVGATLAEVNWDKQTLWQMSIPGGDWVFQGLRLPDKTIAVTSGYGATLVVIDQAAKKVLTTIGGKSQPDAATIVPNFYGGFQVLPNGHFIVTNWEGWPHSRR